MRGACHRRRGAPWGAPSAPPRPRRPAPRQQRRRQPPPPRRRRRAPPRTTEPTAPWVPQGPPRAARGASSRSPRGRSAGRLESLRGIAARARQVQVRRHPPLPRERARASTARPPLRPHMRHGRGTVARSGSHAAAPPAPLSRCTFNSRGRRCGARVCAPRRAFGRAWRVLTAMPQADLGSALSPQPYTLQARDAGGASHQGRPRRKIEAMKSARLRTVAFREQLVHLHCTPSAQQAAADPPLPFVVRPWKPRARNMADART